MILSIYWNIYPSLFLFVFSSTATAFDIGTYLIWIFKKSDTATASCTAKFYIYFYTTYSLLFRLFQPDSFAEEIVYQSRLYAVQQSIAEPHLITMDNYRCTEAALLLSGYHSPPRRHMMWEEKMDCYNNL